MSSNADSVRRCFGAVDFDGDSLAGTRIFGRGDFTHTTMFDGFDRSKKYLHHSE